MKDRKTTRESFVLALGRTITPFDLIPIDEAIVLLDKMKKQINDTIASNPTCSEWHLDPRVEDRYGDREITFELRAVRPLNEAEIAALKEWDKNLEAEQRKQYEELKKKFGDK